LTSFLGRLSEKTVNARNGFFFQDESAADHENASDHFADKTAK